VVDAACDSASKKFVRRPINVVGAGATSKAPDISAIGGTDPETSAIADGLRIGEGGITGNGDDARFTRLVFTRNISYYYI
jgi:hypothetical protein